MTKSGGSLDGVGSSQPTSNATSRPITKGSARSAVSAKVPPELMMPANMTDWLPDTVWTGLQMLGRRSKLVKALLRPFASNKQW